MTCSYFYAIYFKKITLGIFTKDKTPILQLTNNIKNSINMPI